MSEKCANNLKFATKNSKKGEQKHTEKGAREEREGGGGKRGETEKNSEIKQYY